MSATSPCGTTVVLLGGVGQLYQSDLDVGRRVAERLASEDLGRGIVVEDLYYGGIEVSHLLEDLRPETLVLVGAEARGRQPGTIERRRVDPPRSDPHVLQGSVADAAVGYVAIDLVIGVAAALGTLPGRVIALEVEPAETGPGEALSPAVAEVMEDLLGLARREARRAPLLGVAERVRETLELDRLQRTPALETLEALLGELDRLEREGEWGATFHERDRLRHRIGQGQTGDGMDHLDWGLWWTLIEELDRLEKLEASGEHPGSSG